MKINLPLLILCLIPFSCSRDKQDILTSQNYYLDLDIAGKRFYSGIAKSNPGLTPGNSIQGIMGNCLTVNTSTRYCDPPNDYCFSQNMELDDYQPGTYIPNIFHLDMQQGALITEYRSNRYGAANGSVKVIISSYTKKSGSNPAIITGTITGTILRKASPTLYYTEKLHGKFEIPITD